MEVLRIGARLATGTQVVLEQAENILGGQFSDSITTEAIQLPQELMDADGDEETDEIISKYAEQPGDIKEGLQSAYRSLQRNLNSAAQTILAVPMQVYESSGTDVRDVNKIVVGLHDMLKINSTRGPFELSSVQCRLQF